MASTKSSKVIVCRKFISILTTTKREPILRLIDAFKCAHNNTYIIHIDIKYIKESMNISICFVFQTTTHDVSPPAMVRTQHNTQQQPWSIRSEHFFFYSRLLHIHYGCCCTWSATMAWLRSLPRLDNDDVDGWQGSIHYIASATRVHQQFEFWNSLLYNVWSAAWLRILMIVEWEKKSYLCVGIGSIYKCVASLDVLVR